MDHPKFIALTDGAFRLWCEAQTYCQKHLTDGVILFSALKGFRYYSPARVKCLTTEHVAGKGPCWHQRDGGVFVVHDYLDWNDSREAVLQARERSKERRRRFDARTERIPNAVPNEHETRTASSGVYVKGSTGGLPSKLNGSSHARGTNPTDFTEAVSLRAGEFVDRYKELYVTHRHGAHYVGNPQSDFREAALLCETFDDARLEKLATVFLTTDHDFAKKGSRTLAQFRSMASWCDSRLRERGL